jgi:hypothetical protein
MKQPTPSDILIKLIEGDSEVWPGLEMDELFYTGESAEIEQEGGFIDYALKSGGFTPTIAGWYMIEGFQTTFDTDYLGEVDATFDVKNWRWATRTDGDRFGVKIGHSVAKPLGIGLSAVLLIILGFLLAGCVTLSPLQQELVIDCPRREVSSVGAFIDSMSDCSTLALRVRI